MKLGTSICFFGAVLALAGCGDDSRVPADSGTDAITVDSGMEDSGPADTGAPDTGPSTLFGPCSTDDQCPGPDAYCRTAVEDGVPGGQCVRRCAITAMGMPDRTNCEDPVEEIYHVCWQFEGEEPTCEERCLNGADCVREGFTCVGQGSFGLGDVGICVPVCTTDEQCGAGAECNRYSGRCIAEGTLPTGSENGDMCDNDSQCISDNCIMETNMGTPTGWTRGYCIGVCILPVGYNSSTFYTDAGEGPGLPQGTCPDGDVCFPNGSLNRGDQGACLEACSTDADCRADQGYYCRKSYQTGSGMYTFDTGACFPIDCSVTPCPTGYTCRDIPTTSGTISVCESL
jgi:hypothetical protein